ncbi:MAG: hypothetical protein HQ477_12030 [Chloroflexi bacterium]|nr:hypothetical protein [Chloroflexota bacterium]
MSNPLPSTSDVKAVSFRMIATNSNALIYLSKDIWDHLETLISFKQAETWDGK